MARLAGGGKQRGHGRMARLCRKQGVRWQGVSGERRDAREQRVSGEMAGSKGRAERWQRARELLERCGQGARGEMAGSGKKGNRVEALALRKERRLFKIESSNRTKAPLQV